ncbi:MAG: MotA/TolQ/ExbB proton channel family protein [Planctomycetota bacterium]
MIDIETLRTRLESTLQDAVAIWDKGGWAMWAIAVIALVMFALGFHIWFSLLRTGHGSVRERVWRRWIDHPLERRGRIGEMLDLIQNCRSVEEVGETFRQIRQAETLPFERDLKVMKICVSSAPLVGLLGTVTGMLATFGALSSGGAADQTMGKIAAGISEALITTETGLVIALPGLFIQSFLARGFERYRAFLAHLESVCSQTLYRRLRDRADLDRLAREEIAAALWAQLSRRESSSASRVEKTAKVAVEF